MPAHVQGSQRSAPSGLPRRALSILFWVALVASGCGGGNSNAGGASTVVATTSIWADVVENIACGGQVEIVTLIPAGGDPHAFEPSLADRGDMERAALVVANGLLLEEGLDDTVEAVENAGTPVFRIAEHIETIDYSASSSDHDEPEQAHTSGDDPHVWFDPTRVALMLPDLADSLVEHVGLDPEAVSRCLADYQATLVALDAEISQSVAALPADRRKLVTSHDALGYFADRYGFQVIGTIIPASSGLAETSPAQLEALAELVEAEGVSAIFAETQHSTDEADALAERLGAVDVIMLTTGTLGEAASGADTYVGLLRTNAASIVAGLG